MTEKESRNEAVSGQMDDLAAVRACLLGEQGAAALYRAAAEASESPSGRDAFLYLAEAEDLHVQRLTQAWKDLTDEPLPAPQAPDQTFSLPDPGASALTAISRGLAEETASRKRYQELSAVAQNEAVRRLLLELARDEDQHIHLLEAMEQAVTLGGLHNFDYRRIVEYFNNPKTGD